MRVVLSHVNTPQGTTNMEGALMVCAFDLDQPQCLAGHEQGGHGRRDEGCVRTSNHGLPLTKVMPDVQAASHRDQRLALDEDFWVLM